jgi:hypothetical protein
MKRLLQTVAMLSCLSSPVAAEQWDGTWPPPEVIRTEDLLIGGLLMNFLDQFNEEKKFERQRKQPIYIASDPNNLNTSGMNTAFNDYKRRASDGDQLLKATLSGYPHRAYRVSMTNATYNMQNRDMIVNVNFVVSWNPSFLAELNHTLQQTGNDTSSPTHWAFVNTLHSQKQTGPRYRFDQTRGELLIHTLYQAGPQIRVMAGNRSMGCWDIPELSGRSNSRTGMVQTTRDGATFRTWMELQSSISFPVQTPPDNIRLEVVNQNLCL